METRDYEKWKSSVVASNQQNKKEGIESIFGFSLYWLRAKNSWCLTLFTFSLFVAPCKRTKQSRLNFIKKSSDTQELEAMWDGIAMPYDNTWFC